MMQRQRGTLNLFWLAVFMAGFAALGMVALFSLRTERNLLAQAWTGAVRAVGASAALQGVKPGVAPAPLRKCRIDGQWVVSNLDCTAGNATSVLIKMHDSRGIEAPKAPALGAAAPVAPTMTEKMIEKAIN